MGSAGLVSRSQWGREGGLSERNYLRVGIKIRAAIASPGSATSSSGERDVMIMSASDIVLKAPNKYVKSANGVPYAYRGFGAASPGVPPLVMLQHFRGNLDDWDPLLLGALASRREVIPVDNAGVGLSSGTVPRTIAEMARDALAFIDALGLTRIDLLGFSIGGVMAPDRNPLCPPLP